MDSTHSSLSTRFKVGIFAIAGVAMVFAITVIVNNKPFWWRSCQLVNINVEDATGLKTKSPIRSLGIEIGYLETVNLTESHVSLGICITAPVEVLPTTRAYIRGEGFLGDKFVELKPVKYVGPVTSPISSPDQPSGKTPDHVLNNRPIEEFKAPVSSLMDFLFPKAYAATESGARTASKKVDGGGREIPVGQESQDIQHLVNRVDDLVQQMSGLTDNLRKSINPEELKQTMKQLNHTLDNASKTLAPEGGLNQTAQRSLAKLEDAIEQFRDQLTRVNKGEGSVGMLLNDPTYAEEIRQAIKNVNRLLTKVGDVRFQVDVGAYEMTAYNGGRAWFQLGIWPRPDRYYLLGIASDPRGKISNTTTTTTAGGLTQTVNTQIVDQTGILLTGMLGKVFYNRLDLSVGALYGDGAVSINLWLGPKGEESKIQFRNDVYVRNAVGSIDDRVTLSYFPLPTVYARVGIESFRQYNGQIPVFFGAGLSFDDEDIKLLFALK